MNMKQFVAQVTEAYARRLRFKPYSSYLCCCCTDVATANCCTVNISKMSALRADCKEKIRAAINHQTEVYDYLRIVIPNFLWLSESERRVAVHEFRSALLNDLADWAVEYDKEHNL